MERSSGSGPPTCPPSQDISQWLFASRRQAFVPITAAGQRGICTPLPLLNSFEFNLVSAVGAISPRCKESGRKLRLRHKKSPHVPKHHTDFPYSKSFNPHSTLPISGELFAVGIIGRSSGSRIILRAPSQSTDQWHSALRHRLQRRVRGGFAPLFSIKPFRAPLIRYSVFIDS